MLGGDARPLADIVQDLFGGGGGGGGGDGEGEAGKQGGGGGGVMGDDDGQLRAMCEDIVGGMAGGGQSFAAFQPTHFNLTSAYRL
jgi:hypothetical protein